MFKPEKSSGPPSQSVKYLGIIINSLNMTFEIPTVKFEFIITEASFFLETKFFPVKRLASWVGKLQSLRLAIGPIVSIMCKSLYNLIKLAFSWSSYIQLDKNSNIEITWWKDNLKYFSSYPIIIDSTTVKVDTSVSSDALARVTLWSIWTDILN